MWRLQLAAANYESQQLDPIAVSAEVPGAAYWTRGVETTRAKAKAKGAHVVQAHEFDTEECMLVQDMQQTKLDMLAKQLGDVRTEMIELDRRNAERNESRLKEQKKEIEEDLVKPMDLKNERMETMMLQNNQSQSEILQLLKSGAQTTQPTQQSMLPSNRSSGMPGMMGAGRMQYGRPRSQYNSRGQAGPKRPLICFHCKKEGHPFRLCPELNVNAVMQTQEALEYWDQGGTDVCSVEEIRQAFDPKEELQDTMLCMVVTKWAEDKVYNICTLGDSAICSSPSLSVAVQTLHSEAAQPVSVPTVEVGTSTACPAAISQQYAVCEQQCQSDQNHQPEQPSVQDQHKISEDERLGRAAAPARRVHDTLQHQRYEMVLSGRKPGQSMMMTGQLGECQTMTAGDLLRTCSNTEKGPIRCHPQSGNCRTIHQYPLDQSEDDGEELVVLREPSWKLQSDEAQGEPGRPLAKVAHLQTFSTLRFWDFSSGI
jgi:hypothetical protein